MKKITNRIPKWIDWAAQALVAYWRNLAWEQERQTDEWRWSSELEDKGRDLAVLSHRNIILHSYFLQQLKCKHIPAHTSLHSPLPLHPVHCTCRVCTTCHTDIEAGNCDGDVIWLLHFYKVLSVKSCRYIRGLLCLMVTGLWQRYTMV